jgi:uncharacterized protein
MAGIIILLFLSHFILRYTINGNIKMLGVCLDAHEITIVLLAILCPILLIIVLHYSISVVVDNPYKVNSNYSTRQFTMGIWYLVKSVVYEELVFRGALFYVVMKKFGIRTAVIASSAAFGIYHWFSFDVIGNPAKMLYVFVNTGLMGYCLARSFVVSKSILLPIGFHFGLNFALMILLSADKRIGQQLLVKSYAVDHIVPNPVLGAVLLCLYYFGPPLLIHAFLKIYKAHLQPC